jgi:hypothetical protein
MPSAVHWGGWPANQGRIITLINVHIGTPSAAAVIILST